VTVMVRAFEQKARDMKIPRTLTVRHPMGRPLGAAGDEVRHHEVLNSAFDLLESATTNGTLVEFPKDYRPTPKG
jgi:hypothetical protein